jgi:hypothetical protein
MHYLRHKGMVRALKIGSFFFVLSALSFFCFLGSIVYLLIGRDLMTVAFIAGSFALSVLFRILSLICSTRTHCQLCQASLLSLQSCAMHRKASPLFASYRLRLSFSVLCRPSYTCIFCGESFSTDYVDPNIRNMASNILAEENRIKEAQIRKSVAIRNSSLPPRKKR